jgi:hypothetical protein
MTIKAHSKPRLAAHERLISGDHNVDHIVFRCESAKKPGTFYVQIDVFLGFFTTSRSGNFISPRAISSPTATEANVSWVYDKAEYLWKRGTHVCPQLKFVFRVFDAKGEYKTQLFFGKTWNKFDKLVQGFDPNNEKTVKQYNTWIEKVVTGEHTIATTGKDGESSDPAIPERSWTWQEIATFRSYLNKVIFEDGLIHFATQMSWEETVTQHNLLRQRFGWPEVSLAHTKQFFKRDCVIQSAVRAGLGLQERANWGIRIRGLKPRDFLPLSAVEKATETVAVAEGDQESNEIASGDKGEVTERV